MLKCDHSNSSDCPDVCCRHRVPHKETKKPEPHYGCTELDTCMGTKSGIKIVVKCIPCGWLDGGISDFYRKLEYQLAKITI